MIFLFEDVHFAVIVFHVFILLVDLKLPLIRADPARGQIIQQIKFSISFDSDPQTEESATFYLDQISRQNGLQHFHLNQISRQNSLQIHPHYPRP